MPQPMQRVERALRVATQIRGWAGAIEDYGIRNVVRIFRRIKAMRGGVEAFVWNASPFELDEQRLEPIGVLVIDRERLVLARSAHLVLDIRDYETRNKSGSLAKGDRVRRTITVSAHQFTSRAFIGIAGESCHPANR